MCRVCCCTQQGQVCFVRRLVGALVATPLTTPHGHPHIADETKDKTWTADGPMALAMRRV